MTKKGQSVIFIIIGIVIIAALITVISLRFSRNDIDIPVANLTSGADNDTCFVEESRKSLFLIGNYGGYIDLDDDYAYYADEGKLIYPGLENIQRELRSYLRKTCGEDVEVILKDDAVKFISDKGLISYDVRLKLIYEVAERIAEKNKEAICVSCLMDVEEGLHVYVYKVDPKLRVVRLVDKYSELAGGEYEFRFAIKL